MGWGEGSWPGLNAGLFGLVANAGNRRPGRQEGIAVAGTCTRESSSCTGPAWCIVGTQSSGCSRAKSCRIVRRHRRPRRSRKDKPSRGSISSPGCVPSRTANRRRIGGMGWNRDKMASLGDSNRSSSACDQTWGFAWLLKLDSRDSLTVAGSC